MLAGDRGACLRRWEMPDSSSRYRAMHADQRRGADGSEVVPWVAVIERLWDDPEFVSQEPGMTASFAGARARGSQRGLTTPVPWEKRGRTAPVMRDRCVTRSPRILSCAERGTGLDHRLRVRFHPDSGRGSLERASWRYPSLALSISVRLQGVPASHRSGFQRRREK